MKPSVAPASTFPSQLSKLAALAAVVVLPWMAGCAGQLEGNFPPPPGSTGSGGSGTASGGSTGSGGSGSGTGGMVGSGGSGSGSGGSSTVCDAPGTVFKNTCGTGVGCHNSGITPDLFTAPVENGLIGQPVVFNAGSCASTKLVNSTKPASGALFDKISGTTCSDRMPPGGPFLTADQIQCITDWVNSKLPN